MKKIFKLFITTFLILLSFNLKAYTANNRWMSNIDNNKYISELSIPGTHDSGALYEPLSGTAKCQKF